MDIVSPEEARKLGLSGYFTGRPCKFGHVCERRFRGRRRKGFCIECRRERDEQYRQTPRGKILLAAAKRAWYDKNKDQAIAAAKTWKKKNPEKVVAINKIWGEKNKERIAHTARARSILYKLNNGESPATTYQRERRKLDPTYKLTRNLRARMRQCFKRASKSAATMELIGCTPQFLREYIESLFQPGMSFENYGYGQNKWHIDHIVALKYFDMTDAQQQRQAFNYINLQPLWQKDNFHKSAKLGYELKRA